MMTLGTYTFTMNPAGCTLPIVRRRSQPVETISGVEVFNWGTIIAGSRIVLTWEFCPTTQFDSLEVLLVADAQVVFNPETGTSYNVEILSLNGAIHIDPTASAAHRKDVTMELLIISVVVT